MHEILAAQSRKYGDRILAEFDDRSLSYLDLHHDSLRIAAGLQKYGVRKGEPVMLMLGNRSEYLTTFFATAHTGAVAVPVNIALKGAALAHVFRTTRPRILVIDAAFMDRFLEAAGGADGLDHIFVMGGSAAGPAPTSRPFDELRSAPAEPETMQIRNGDPWSIMFTSGTTGVAKGVILSHQQVASAAWDTVHDLGMDEASVFYTFHPLFHLNGLVFGPLAAILAGGKTVVRMSFPREHTLADLRRCAATHWVVLPFMVRELLSAPERLDDADNALRIVLTLGLTETEITEFQERFGCTLASGYGSTEAGMICRFQTQYPATAGRVSDRYQMRIVDHAGNDVPEGETGEIWVRARRPFDCMLGYYNMPEATAAAFSGGWFRTGDLGYLDANKCLNFTDRLKDSLKRRGENISTFEVEKALMTFPGVRGVAVVGYRDGSGMDEEVRAFIEVSADALENFDYGALIRHCSKNLAYFMVPRFINLVAELPRTSLGKIEKEKLKQIPLSPSAFDLKTSGMMVER
jgi:crotonobetaine/carnitine-CoA ligase